MKIRIVSTTIAYKEFLQNRKFSEMKITAIFLILFLGFVGSSCLNRHFIDGKSELISISDTTLNDSSIFVGYARNIDYPLPIEYEIWLENTTNSAVSDSIGFYAVRVTPGTYSIKCQSKGNRWPRLTEGIGNVIIEKNKKVRIDFYIGYTIE